MPDVAALAQRVRGLHRRRGERCVVGIAGPPGAGKSTLARAVVQALGEAPVVAAALVPMDGFHLAGSELERLGRQDRKGAPDTFDAAGYVALLERLRHGHVTVYAPEFRREIEEAVAGAVAVDPDVEVVVTEGNYLLLDEGAWAGVRPLLDEVWYLDLAEDLRVERLVARHVAHGRPAAAARSWALGPDQRNAERIAGTRERADLVLRAT